MYQYFMEYELANQRADHEFETAFDAFAITTLEIAHNKATGLYTESSSEYEDIILEEAGKFLAAVKDFFKKLIENFRKLVHDVSVKIAADIQGHKVNVKLKQIKAELTARRVANSDIEIIDVAKYRKAYHDYIMFAVAQYKKLYSKEYTEFSEYQKALTEYEEAIDKKYQELKLNEEEAFVLTIQVTRAIDLTEKEINSMNSSIKAFENEFYGVINSLEEMTKGLTDSSMVNHIKSVATKMSNDAGHVLKKIVDGPVKTVNKLISALNKSPKKEETSESEGKDE